MSAFALLFALLGLACSADTGPERASGPTIRPGPVPEGPLDDDLRANLEGIVGEPIFLSGGDILAVGESGDVRVAWPLVDLIRFHEGQALGPDLIRAVAALTGVQVPDEEVAWVEYSDLLLQNDVPAPPGYLALKRPVYIAVDEGWEPFFTDEDSTLDWRLVSWGGVRKDGISTLDDPPLVDVAEGRWLPDDDVVFGVELGGETVAYPKRVMEVHELVNDRVGGRAITIPYCTLCGAAVGFFADDIDAVDGTLELRTSGLLQRSNKLAYDPVTESLFDAFDGEAVTGPLREAGVELTRFPITVTTWSEWRRTHPRTKVTPEEIDGRSYEADPLGGRDDEGPIFPVGDVDPRMETHAVVFGVRTARGVTVAFPVDDAKKVLRAGGDVSEAGVRLELTAGGLAVADRDATGQEAFWFAWSQFNPGTRIWEP